MSLLFSRMPKTIIFYGDSYVSRLQDYCHENLRVPNLVCWYGKGGLRSDFVNRHGQVDFHGKAMFQEAKEMKPDVVFVNVGGNDLTTTSLPRQIYDQIVAITVDFKRAGAKEIYVAEIISRGDFSKCPDPEMNKTCFDRQRRKINSLLASEFKEKFIRFSDIHYPVDYLPDLVHLSTKPDITRNTGMKKFESRLRRVICSLKQ